LATSVSTLKSLRGGCGDALASTERDRRDAASESGHRQAAQLTDVIFDSTYTHSIPLYVDMTEMILTNDSIKFFEGYSLRLHEINHCVPRLFFKLLRPRVDVILQVSQWD
jgi:hypothetical protein